MYAELWTYYENSASPSLDDLRQTGLLEKNGSPLLTDGGEATKLYIQIQKLYRLLVSLWLTTGVGLQRLDIRLSRSGFQPAPDQEKDFFQKYDMMGLDFFYLRSFVHVERLAQEPLQAFQDALATHNEESLGKAIKVIEATYLDVLALDPEHKEEKVELYPSLYNTGTAFGSSIVLAIKTASAFPPGDMAEDISKEASRIHVLYSIKQQLEPILENAWKTHVLVTVQV